MKLTFTLTCVLFYAICYSQTIIIPDKNFERVLVENGIDSDKTINGYILKIDVQTVTFLDLYSKNIKSLKGIEAFISLTYLDCRNNDLSKLDVSKNIALKTLFSDVNNSVEQPSTTFSFDWFD